MSAYITLLTPMMDQDCLLAALSDAGFGSNKVEVHPVPVPLVGYEGDQRTQVANIVIRRRYAGQSSNDVGFLATEIGYQAIISDYDQSRYGANWMAQLHSLYQSHWAAKLERAAAAERRRLEEERQRLVEAQRQAIHEKAKKMGYRVQESREGGALRLVLVKRTY